MVAYAALALVWSMRRHRRAGRKGRALGSRSRAVTRRMAGEQVRAPGVDARIRF